MNPNVKAAVSTFTHWSARAGFALVLSSAVACASGELVDFGDAGDVCTDTPCADAHVADAAHPIDAGHFDSGLIDSSIGDASTNDSTAIDSGLIDASIDASIDSAIDTGVDTGVDSSVDAGPTCLGGLSGSARRYGNVTPFASSSSHAPNDLLGSPLTIPQGGTLLGFGVVGRVAGSHVELALYTDSGGRPGTLVAQTSSTLVCVGSIEVSGTVQPVIGAGSYWILGVYDVNASIGYDLSVSTASVDWISQPYASPLPTTYPSSSNRYTGQQFNYWVVVQ